jgi:polyhydroxyalkanoate synthesis regulator phasin
MTPLASMWLASLVGAALFFVSGFFLARRHSTLAAAVDAVVPPRVPPPVVDSPPATAAADPAHAAEDVDTLRAQVNDLRNALREARVREQGHADVERELLRLRAERAQVEQKARRELAIELEASRRRAGELQQVHEENAALRQQVAELSADRDRLGQAEAELRDLRARQVAASPPRLPRPLGSGTLRPAGDPRSTAEQLSGLLARVRGKSMRGIALADDLGLPIVGLGDDTGSLAAFAGYLTEIGRKTRDFLPLAALRRVTVEDENETTVTACPHGAGDGHIALVTLTAGAGPSARQMTDVLRSAASLVR